MKNEMKMKNLSYLLVALSLLFVSCSDDDEGGASVLVPEATEVVLSGDGESKTLAVNCDGDWSIEVSETWCKALRDKNSLVISAEENKTGGELNANIVLRSGDLSAIVKVTQSIPLPAINETFAATTEHWFMDLNGFEGAFKTAYDEAKADMAGRATMDSEGYVLQHMYLTKDTIDYCFHDEDYKEMGAPEFFYVYNGSLLFVIEAVAGTKDQVVFKEIKLDPKVDLTNPDDNHSGDQWYGSEEWGSPKFKAFVDVLAAQTYVMTADNAANPTVLTFKGVEDSGSVFKLQLNKE